MSRSLCSCIAICRCAVEAEMDAPGPRAQTGAANDDGADPATGYVPEDYYDESVVGGQAFIAIVSAVILGIGHAARRVSSRVWGFIAPFRC